MFACLLVPDFPVQAALLWEPKDTRESLRRSPIAVLDGPSDLPKVLALNDAARNTGIHVGMTKLQVETCGGVLLRKRSADHEDSAQAALLECANRFSPRVESTCPGTVILDLTGTEKLFGSPETTACKITVSARHMGFHLRIAIAANPDTAMYAARGFAGITVIPAGDESQNSRAVAGRHTAGHAATVGSSRRLGNPHLPRPCRLAGYRTGRTIRPTGSHVAKTRPRADQPAIAARRTCAGFY